jgi:methionine-rich copper-binding protein CopC
MTRRLVMTAAACATLALPATATAHTGIKSRSPGPGATVSRAISVVKVNFEGRISDATLTVKRSGIKVNRGNGTLANGKRQVRARLSSSRSGRYRAQVRWLSRDGHVLTKSWSFRVR